ncbi:MAG: site-specific DNA-methyltransferase [Gammaproteobacteria bacterium]|nr:site-specific DNA-methyltransferase [Gammaproteobacteria bacterium]
MPYKTEARVKDSLFEGGRVAPSARQREEADGNPFIDTVQCGDCVSILKRMPKHSVDAVVTSPPYFQQRDYSGIGIGNEGHVDAYIDSLLVCLKELLRVVKPTGNIVYNLGDKYINSSLLLVPYRFAIAATETFGLTLVNQITWAKVNPTPRQFKRRLVSSTEPFFHFVKNNDYHYARDKFMNEPRVKQNSPTERLGGKYRALIAESSLTTAQKIHALRCLDEVVNEVRKGDIQGFRMKIRGVHAPAFGGQDGGRKIQMQRNGFTIIRLHGEPMKKDFIQSPVETIKGIEHPAIFPLEVVREFIKLLCPAGGVVLDPYVGSGTTLLAAREENCRYIGIDINPAYCEYADRRLKHA